MPSPIKTALICGTLVCITPIVTAAQALQGTNDPQTLGGLVAWILAGGGLLSFIVASMADRHVRTKP